MAQLLHKVKKMRQLSVLCRKESSLERKVYVCLKYYGSSKWNGRHSKQRMRTWNASTKCFICSPTEKQKATSVLKYSRNTLSINALLFSPSLKYTQQLQFHLKDDKNNRSCSIYWAKKSGRQNSFPQPRSLPHPSTTFLNSL